MSLQRLGMLAGVLLLAGIAGFIRTSVETPSIFQTGFEDIQDVSGFYLTPQNHLGTTSHTLTEERIHGGVFSHKAWINGANSVVAGQNTNHRGYPTIQLYKTASGVYQGKVVTEFWVWLNVPLERVENKNWFSFATFTTYADDFWQRTVLVNLDADRIVHLMHVPDQGKGVRDIYQTTTKKFPMRKWVHLKTLLDFTDNNEYNSPYAKVWQDGELVSAARFNPRLDLTEINPNVWPPCLDSWDRNSIEEAERLCSLVYTGGLAQAHFGMYAPPLLSSGVVYNDDLTISEVNE